MARPGNSECGEGMMAGDRGRIAGFGGHQAVDRSLAECSRSCSRLSRGIDIQAPAFADARHQPGQNADDAGTQHGAPILKDLAKSRQHGSRISTIFRSTGSASVVSTSAKPNAPTNAGSAKSRRRAGSIRT